ncbi:MAG: hypothetical protein HY598_02640 [Candidatus Omnitrophica bacterium]|nr:hypothetical protein [Candidatus Omnitrophota bacterium]
MIRQDILKDAEFEAVTEARVDAKHRVALGRLPGMRVSSYRVYRNRVGQIILDPLVTVPAYEAWLFKNPEAMKRVKEGLEDARKGRTVKAKEDYTKYLNDEA